MMTTVNDTPISKDNVRVDVPQAKMDKCGATKTSDIEISSGKIRVIPSNARKLPSLEKRHIRVNSLV
jgi:hypothetical protein